MRRLLWLIVVVAIAWGAGWWRFGGPDPRTWKLPEYVAGLMGNTSGAPPPAAGEAPSRQAQNGPGAGARGPAGPGRPGGRRQNDGPPRVQTAPATRGDVPVTVSGLGVATALKTATVKPEVDGKIVEILFKEGKPVKAGDPLVRIDSKDYEAAWRKAAADTAQQRAQLVLAKQLLDRQKLLGQRDVASKETIETAQAKLDQMEAAVASAAQTEERSRIDYENTTVRAPWDGLTGMRVVDEGNIIHATDAAGLVVMTQVDPISVVFTLPADALPASIRSPSAQGRKVELLARDRRTVTATGELVAVDNQIDQSTNAIKLKAIFDNADYTLWPGQFVTARLTIDTMRDAVSVPASAVQRNADGAFIFVVKPGDKPPEGEQGRGRSAKVEQRKVEIAFSRDDTAVVSSGLQAGERVVVDGQYKLKDGTVIIPESAESKTAERPVDPS